MQDEISFRTETSGIVEHVFRIVDDRLRKYLRQQNISRRIKNVPHWCVRDVRVKHRGNGYFIAELTGRCLLPRDQGPFDLTAKVKFRVYIAKRRGVHTPGRVVGIMNEAGPVPAVLFRR